MGARPPLVRMACEAMRTRFEVVLADERDEPSLRAAGEEALEEIARVERELSAFRKDAALFELNARADEEPVRVDPELFRFLERAAELGRRLGGAVDLTAGALVAHHRAGGRGGPEALAAALACVGFDRNVRLDEEALTVAFARPGVRLDAGAFGKGYALDRAAAALRDCGVHNALLHGGTSSVLGLGSAPGGAGETGRGGWGVALEHPLRDGLHLGRVSLCDQALSVSTIYGRTFESEGRVVGHIMDPRTGAPVEHTALAAVVATSALEAEAMSTALLVLGATEGTATVAREFPDASALVLDAASADTVRSPVFLGSAISSIPG